MEKLLSDSIQIKGTSAEIREKIKNLAPSIMSDRSVLSFVKINDNEFIIGRRGGMNNTQETLFIEEDSNFIKYVVHAKLINYEIVWEINHDRDYNTVIQSVFIGDRLPASFILHAMRLKIGKELRITLERLKFFVEQR